MKVKSPPMFYYWKGVYPKATELGTDRISWSLGRISSPVITAYLLAITLAFVFSVFDNIYTQHNRNISEAQLINTTVWPKQEKVALEEAKHLTKSLCSAVTTQTPCIYRTKINSFYNLTCPVSLLWKALAHVLGWWLNEQLGEQLYLYFGVMV